MSRSRSAAIAGGLAFLLVGMTACSSPDQGTTPVQLSADAAPDETPGFQKTLFGPAPSGLARVEIEITAPDMDPIARTLSLTAGQSVMVSLDVPSGAARRFAAYAFDVAGEVRYKGETVADLTPDLPTTVTIQMQPLLITPILTVTVAGTGSGTVTSDPTGIDCGMICAAAFDIGTVVTLTAGPDVGSVFAGWNGEGCTGTGACAVTMDAVKSVTAAFDLTPQLVSITVVPANPSIAAGGSQPFTATGTFSDNSTYNLTGLVTWNSSNLSVATISLGGVAMGIGGGTSTITATSGSVSGSTILTVTAPPSFTLNVPKTGNGIGTVTSNIAGISCGLDCTEVYANGTIVTLTAVPATGSTFTGWSGACTGTGSCIVTMDAAKSVTATFTLQIFTLTVAKAGAGTGTVTSLPTGINCGTTCAASFNVNTVVTLTALADSGSIFAGWNGEGCTGTGACAVTMGAAKAVTATFDIVPPNTSVLTVTKGGSGIGTVTSNIAGISCGLDCTEAYA
ncbi:MAG: Ig-like domain-containing protein, partial [Nitrospirota bacterium]